MNDREMATVFDALGHEIRLQIYRALERGGGTVKKRVLLMDITVALGEYYDRTTLDFHLEKMAQADIITIKTGYITLKKRIDVKITDIKG